MGTGISFVTNRPHKFKFVDDGLLFRQFYKYDIADEGVKYLLFKVGDKYPHMLISGVADGDVRIEIYHTPTISADGVEEASGNFNFNSSKTSLTTWFPEPTISADGTYIGNTWILGGSGVATPAASTTTSTLYDIDTVLVPNTNFIFKITNNADRAMHMLIECTYIEVLYDYS